MISAFASIMLPCDDWYHTAVFSIWCVRLHVHMPAHVSLVWCVLKIAHTTSIYDTYYLVHWNEKNETKVKSIKLSNWSFFVNLCYTFVRLNVVLPCIVWLQNKGKIVKFGVKTIINLIYSKHSCVSLLEPGQSNPEAYSEPCQISKMECFAKIIAKSC